MLSGEHGRVEVCIHVSVFVALLHGHVWTQRNTCCGMLCWNQIGHIDVSDAVAAKHKPLSTRMDPLQRN
jgi:hypothetical protein